MKAFRTAFVASAVFVVAALPVVAGEITSQNHSWGTYHWKKTGARVTPPIYDNVSATWQIYLDRAVTDWNSSQGPITSAYNVNSPLSNVKRCTSVTGAIEVCNSTYGQTGWLGIAGISLSGGHIVKGYTKLNDTYFNTPQYNTPAWRRMVTCQEVGHDYGLGHVNETFTDTNTGSCMDYTNDPSGTKGTNGSLSNEYPNSHDYQQLNLIYNHTEAAGIASPVIDSAVGAYSKRAMSVAELLAGADQWGSPISYDGNGRPDVFALHTGDDDHGGDGVNITHVFWAPVDPFDEEHRNNRRK